MNRAPRYLLAVVLCAAMMSPLASAKVSGGGHRGLGPELAREDRGNPDRSGRSNAGDSPEVRKDKDEEPWERDPIVFSARDRDAIRNYYRGAPSNLPPGLAMRNGNPPPGLQRRLQRNGMLPPGLRKRIEPLADDLERRLDPLYSGYSRGTIGPDAVIVDNRTLRIVDLIRDIAGPPLIRWQKTQRSDSGDSQ